MKKFISNSFLLTIIILVYLLFIQILVSFRIEDLTTTGQDNWEQTKNENIDVVFLGNSRCIGSIVPSQFNRITHLKSINLGANGQDNFIFFEKRLNRFLINGNSKPKFVIIVCEPINSENKQFEQKDRFARYAFNSTVKDTALLNYFEFDKLDKYIPSMALLRYKRLFDCLLLNNKSTFEKFGYSKFFGKMCHQNITDFQIDLVTRNQFKYYKQLLKFNTWLKEKKIKLIAIQLPMLGMNKLKYQVFKNEKMVKKMGVSFINLFSKRLNNCEYFSDRFHPNEVGATLFTKELAVQFNKKNK
jgi:hypothetical protein